MGLKIIRGHLPCHPAWPLIRRYLVIQNWPPTLQRGTFPTRLERLEIDRSSLLIEQQLALLAIEMPCVTCGRMIHPVKKRKNWRTLYVHVTCDTTVKVGCSRSKAARVEIDAIVAALRA
jgi:hypothetical protein